MLERRGPLDGSGSGFVLYVEGPRDRDILRIWARRLSPLLARRLARSAVILGGRQPARAIAHFRELRARGDVRRGLCVLDRDEGNGGPDGFEGEPGLDFFTWSRRHIESYLLVPEAIQRVLRLRASDSRVARSLRDLIPELGDEQAAATLDAKRLLAPNGPLAQTVGFVTPGRVARAMRTEEFHPDVRALLERLCAELGVAGSELLVGVRNVFPSSGAR